MRVMVPPNLTARLYRGRQSCHWQGLMQQAPLQLWHQLPLILEAAALQELAAQHAGEVRLMPVEMRDRPAAMYAAAGCWISSTAACCSTVHWLQLLISCGAAHQMATETTPGPCSSCLGLEATFPMRRPSRNVCCCSCRTSLRAAALLWLVCLDLSSRSCKFAAGCRRDACIYGRGPPRPFLIGCRRAGGRPAPVRGAGSAWFSRLRPASFPGRTLRVLT